MKMNVRGLIIKKTDVGDYDRAVSILTAEHGIIRAYANGARRIKSRKMASTGLLCYADFALSDSKGSYKIDEASPINVFFGLSPDIEALSLAQYFCELCLTFVEEEHSTENYLPLILNSLAFLENRKYPLRQIKAITEMRLLTLAGYMPDLYGCECEPRGVLKFDIEDGVLLCSNCADNQNYGLISINDTTVAALRYIVGAEFKKLYSFSVSNEDLENICNVCEAYTVARAEKNLKTLQFYNSIRLPEK